MKTVSVIIPNKNRAELLREALRSVTEQTVPVHEIIVSDNLSTDESVDVVKSFKGVKIIEKAFKNQSIARNAAVALATGEYIALLDSDDLWLPTKIEEHMAFIESQPEFSFTYTDATVLDMTHKEPRHSYVYNYQKENAYQGNIAPKLLNEYNVIPTSTVMVKRAIFLEVGGFDENLSYHEDRNLWIRLAQKGPVGFLDKALSIYRVHGNQVSSNKILRDEQWKLVKAKYNL